LKLFSPRRDVLTLKGLKFKAFFEWLSRSVSKISISRLDETVTLDPTSGWGTL